MTTATARKSIAIICRKPPYGNALSREALDIALATAVFDQKLAVIFTGDGVWQLLKQQNSDAIHAKNQGKLLSAFPLYDINDIYIDSDALQQRHLSETDLIIEGELLPRKTLATVIDSFDIVFNF